MKKLLFKSSSCLCGKFRVLNIYVVVINPRVILFKSIFGYVKKPKLLVVMWGGDIAISHSMISLRVILYRIVERTAKSSHKSFSKNSR